MPKQAKPVENVFVPDTILPMDGKMYMGFRYDGYKLDPWDWPKVMTYDGMYFKMTGYDSDLLVIHYKQIDTYSLARPVEK